MFHSELKKLMGEFNMFDSVSQEEIQKLLSYNNSNINMHFRSLGTDLERLIQQRGPSFVKAIKDNSLNDAEVLLISGYADFVASYLNRALKDSPFDKRADEYMLYEYLLNKALSKVVSVPKSTVYVMYQCGEDSEAFYSWYENRIGESVQFPNFLSSSKRKWLDFGFYLKIQTIHNSSGKFIAPLTNKEQLEEEVTFMSNSVFKIISIDRENQTIFLEELPRGIQGNYLLYNSYHTNINNKEDQGPRSWLNPNVKEPYEEE